MSKFLLFAPLWALAAVSWAADPAPPGVAPSIVPDYRPDTEPRPLDWRAANARVAPGEGGAEQIAPPSPDDAPAGHAGHVH